MGVTDIDFDGPRYNIWNYGKTEYGNMPIYSVEDRMDYNAGTILLNGQLTINALENLSRLYNEQNCQSTVSYMGIDKKIKTFYKYPELKEGSCQEYFKIGTVFDENGQAIADDKMLFADGYYMIYGDLIDICRQKGLLDEISKDANSILNKKISKELRKEFKQSSEK